MPSLRQRAVNSFAYRSGPLYRGLLRCWPARFPDKPADDRLQVITMSGRNHLLMLEQMLATLARSWCVLPQVRVVSDGSLADADLAQLRRRYTGRIVFTAGAELERHHLARGRPELVQFCRDNYFGRKLALITGAADEGPSLWVDNDVLFFRDLSPDLLRLADGPPLLGATRDASFGKTERFFGYDPGFAQELFGDADIPAVNAGFAFARGAIYDALQLAPLVRRALERGHGYLTEQTIVAWAALHSGGILWDRDVVHLDDKDATTLGPTYRTQSWTARHYTGNIRHLFWRDAHFRRFDAN
jgi:hypothetical protein